MGDRCFAKNLFHRHALRQVSRHILIYQSDRTMLHLGSRITLSMDIADFLQLQGTLHRHRIVYATTQIQEVVRIGKHSGDILDHRSLLQHLLHLLRNLRKFLYHLIIISIVQGSLLMTQSQGKKRKNRYLTGECLRTCHTNLRTHMDIDTRIRFTCDGRTHAVHDTENQRTLLQFHYLKKYTYILSSTQIYSFLQSYFKNRINSKLWIHSFGSANLQLKYTNSSS